MEDAITHTLRVEHLDCGYDGRPVLRDLDFSLDAGELCCILGPNGAGKSTLFRTLLGLLPALGGTARLDGRDLSSLSQRQRARTVAYVPQTFLPTFRFSALDMVLMGRACHLSPLAMPGEKDVALAREALERVGMADRAGRAFSECSGGERQLILCARALAQGSHVLILDEPTASLDFGNSLRLMEQLRRLAEQGFMLLVSTHNPEMALRYADKALLLHGGVMEGCGDPVTLLDEAALFRLYGVHTRRLEVHGERGPVHVFVACRCGHAAA